MGRRSFRRRFERECDGIGLEVLSEVGGWTTPITILDCYEQRNQARLRETLRERGRLVGTASA